MQCTIDILKYLRSINNVGLVSSIDEVDNKSNEDFAGKKDGEPYILIIRNIDSEIKYSNSLKITKWRAVNLNSHNCKAATIARVVKIEPSD